MTALAGQGTKARDRSTHLQGRDPREFTLSTEAQGHLRRFVKFAGRAQPAAVVRGAFPKERVRMMHQVKHVMRWFTKLSAELRRRKA